MFPPISTSRFAHLCRASPRLRSRAGYLTFASRELVYSNGFNSPNVKQVRSKIDEVESGKQRKRDAGKSFIFSLALSQ